MNKRQKAILIEITIVLFLTLVAVVTILNVRDYFNRRAAKFAMMVLGNRIKNYRAEQGSVPSKSWVDNEKETLPGRDRLGEMQYRGMWVDYESDPNEILCFTEKKSRSIIFHDGYLVMRLKEVLKPAVTGEHGGRDINIKWMKKEEFEALLAQQQTPLELEMQYK